MPKQISNGKLWCAVVAATTAAFVSGGAATAAAVSSRPADLNDARLATSSNIPAGCSLKALEPRVRRGQIIGLGELECNHPVHVDFAGAALQRKRLRWKMVTAGGNGNVTFPRNVKNFMPTSPVKCRPGRYRSQIFVAWSNGTTVTLNSRAEVVAC
jgi:hypothetical protein